MKTALYALAAGSIFAATAAMAGGVAATEIREHMQVTGSDGVHVGTVDKVDGNQIVLAKDDPSAAGAHHTLPVDLAEKVGDKKVMLRIKAAQAKTEWKTVAAPSNDKTR